MASVSTAIWASLGFLCFAVAAGTAWVGYQLVQAIYSRDYLVVQGMALVAAVAFVVVNFAVDFLLTLLDPRVRRA